MRHIVALIAVLGSVSGCAGLLDPYVREGTWHITQINDENLRLMVANPQDLEHGVGAPDSLGQTSAAAVVRLRTDNVKALPEESFGPAPSGSSGGNGAPAATNGGTGSVGGP